MLQSLSIFNADGYGATKAYFAALYGPHRQPARQK
jgi:hypothetical protein